MPSIYQLKPLFQNLLRPIMLLMRRMGMTPNQVTMLALLCSIALAVCMVINADSSIPWLVLPAWLFVRMALNAIDGIMARECNMQSPLGALLNELGDVIAWANRMRLEGIELAEAVRDALEFVEQCARE